MSYIFDDLDLAALDAWFTGKDLVDLLTKQHHDLDGLADDDHPQYLNEARHDADDHSGFERTFTVPDSITVNDGGTPVGSVSDVQTFNDGNAYNLPETTGIPGFDVEFVFSGITSVKGIAANFYYAGLASHAVTLDIYNYDDAQWDKLIIVPDAADYSYRYIEFPSDSKYINSGAAKLRFYHSTSGNSSHDLYVDFIAILS